MKRILVSGAGGSPGSNVIKSLRAINERLYIVGIDTSKEHLELTTGLNKKYIVPNTDSRNYLKTLNKIIEKEKIDFLHPQPEQDVLFFSKYKNKINTTIFQPKVSTILICKHKYLSNSILSNNGVRVPKAYIFKDEKTLKKCVKALLKISDKLWLRATTGAGSRAALPVTEFNHAYMWIDYWRKNKGLSYKDFMISEYLPGKEYAFQSVWKNGELIVSQARERLEYLFGKLTPSGQSSSPSIAKTVHNKKVNKLATEAVLAIDNKADGIFCIDIKENKKGEPCIIEINAGRFFTTSDFFTEAGVNMPYIYLKLAYGEKVKAKQYNSVPKGWYWIRMVDMGCKLVKGEKWESKNVET